MNYSDLISSVKGYMAASDSDFVANLNQFILNTESQIFASIQSPVYWKHTSAIEFQEDLPTRPLPAGTIDIIDVRISEVPFIAVSVASQTRALLRKDYSFLMESEPDQTYRGAPKYYAVQNVSLTGSSPVITVRVSPIPDTGYSSEITYYGRTASDSITNGVTSGDPSTNETWVSVVFPNVLLYGTLMHAAIFRQQEPEIIAGYEKEFNNGLLMMKNMAESRQDTDKFSSQGKPASSV